MIDVYRTYDSYIINSILKHPSIKRHMGDDINGDFDYPVNNAIIYLLIEVDGEPAGIFFGMFRSTIMMEVHCAILPEFWGAEITDNAYKLSIKWVKDSTDFKKIVGLTPAYNKPAIAANLRNGFTQEGVCKKSHLKNGKLHDQIMFGMEI